MMRVEDAVSHLTALPDCGTARLAVPRPKGNNSKGPSVTPVRGSRVVHLRPDVCRGKAASEYIYISGAFVTGTRPAFCPGGLVS